MNCTEIKALASNYLDNELPAELHDRLQSHFLKCAECARDLSSLRHAVEALRTAYPCPTPQEEFLRTTLATLSQELNITTRPTQIPGQLILSIGKE